MNIDFQALVSETFLRRILAQGGAGTRRYIIDFVPEDVGRALFDSLMEHAAASVVITLTGDDRTSTLMHLRAISESDCDVIPFLVSAGRHGENVGNEGYASALRDYFAVDADRPRILVVITSGGNETQKSATDALADQVVLSFRGLLEAAIERAAPREPSAFRAVAHVYADYQSATTAWEPAVTRFVSYLDSVATKSDAERGAALPMLGCFLADSREDFASGARVNVLEDRDRSRRERGTSRLHDNAMLREFIEERTNSPLVDRHDALNTVFRGDNELIKTFTESRFDKLDLGAVAVAAGKVKADRRKNEFMAGSLRVEGAHASQVVTIGDTAVVVLCATKPVSIHVSLQYPYDPKKEFARLLTWEGKKAVTEKIDVPRDANAIRFELKARPTGDFAVARLLLARGVRTVSNPIDAIDVVIYGGVHTSVPVESNRRVDFEAQAWDVADAGEFNWMSEGASTTSANFTPAEGAEDDGPTWVNFDGTTLRAQISSKDEPIIDPIDNEEHGREPLVELCAYTSKLNKRIRELLRDGYLSQIQGISRYLGAWNVDFNGASRRIYPANSADELSFVHEQAAAKILQEGVERLEWRDQEWSSPSSTKLPTEVAARRSTVLKAIRERAKRCVAGADSAVPVWLLSLEGLEAEIGAYLEAWNQAVSALIATPQPYGSAHDALLQIDTLTVLRSDALIRLVVLPTHPWLLWSLLSFQHLMRRSFSIPDSKPALTRQEVSALVPRMAVERWNLAAGKLKQLVLADSAPFHLEFVPEMGSDSAGSLEYVERIIANKVGRYLRMHPHLRDERRTLRVGFVNPGDGRHLLGGLELWLRNLQKDRLQALPLEQIPKVDVVLYETRPGASEADALFDFFREHVGVAEDNTVRQTLLARLRYRRSAHDGPKKGQDEVHICFVHRLVGIGQSPKVGGLHDGWDGGFGDGLLATPLRRTKEGIDKLQSVRGFWMGPNGSPGRTGLGHLLALQCGCQLGKLAPDTAIYWETDLPTADELARTFDGSDWVVHLDRELSLDVFNQAGPAERPTLIEYSDQEVPDVPGYDTITVTKKAMPYKEQLGEILSSAALDMGQRGEAERRSANQLLDDINVLSGAWALEFLAGSIADQRTSLRLKGNIGSALCYRWLRRVERGPSSVFWVDSSAGPVVPVFVSLEEILRATPAAELPTKDGLVRRYTNDVDDDETGKKGASWCDDLLVLYLSPAEAGKPSLIHGRIIEVKFGDTVRNMRTKAIAQVSATHRLLTDCLSGSSDRLDRPFRDRQLSLMIKAQLEQQVALGVVPKDVFEFLKVRQLSVNLATGNYSVDYTIRDKSQNLSGDVFLLDTSPSELRNEEVNLVDGVRVVSIPRARVEWLAFEPEDAKTLEGLPRNTIPRLGRYGAVVTSLGVQAEAAAKIVVPADPLPAPPEREILPVVMPQVELAVPAGPAPAEIPSPTSLPPSLHERRQALARDAERPVKTAPYPELGVVDAIARLEKALVAQKIVLAASPSPREADRGPRLLRAYVRLSPAESISSVRRVSEDIARIVGTAVGDIRVTNVPERHAIGLDLPLPGLEYEVTYDELAQHPSYASAAAALTLGFCAGIDVTGRAKWVDLATMPHMLVAGTTGSGKTVFLRSLLLTLVRSRSAKEMTLRLSSSKPMDFKTFESTPHAGGRKMATTCDEGLTLAHELAHEMERRIEIISNAESDNLEDYNRENPAKAMPLIVAVFDEYAEMIASFPEKADHDAFETTIGRLAQKARAAGIHLVICMQRPDAKALRGAIKANILHRFALKLPQNHDSGVILDEPGAETLLGRGDMLYKDGDNRVHRLQVPSLETDVLKRLLGEVKVTK